MKSVVNQPKEQIKEKPFPKLMISKVSGNIVFFEKECIGQVIYLYKGNSKSTLGNIYHDLGMDNFIDFEGSVTLSND